MSGQMDISFTPDMPPATVEVIGPDLVTVDRLWLRPGERKSVYVPSEMSFLRVHLASGESVILKDPGNLDRVISSESLRAAQPFRSKADPNPPSRPRTARLVKQLANASLVAHAEVAVPPLSIAMLDGGVAVDLKSQAWGAELGSILEAGAGVRFTPRLSYDRYILSLAKDDLKIRVRLPGSTQELIVRSDEVSELRRVVTVRVRTLSAEADAISGYMHRGDLYSASAMTDWAEQAEELLKEKRRDPFAAAVGAYLLLRLHRIDLLHDWTRNLATWFPTISDALVIYAWHLIHIRKDEAEIRRLFINALSGQLPVFLEGLKLLSEGVRLLGPGSDAAVDRLNYGVRRAVWGSPFTTTVEGTGASVAAAFDLDIEYASRF